MNRFTKRDTYGHPYTDSTINDRFMWNLEQFSKEYEIRLILENDLSDTNIGPDMIECIGELIETIPPKKPSLHDQHPELNQTLIDLWRKKKHPWMYK